MNKFQMKFRIRKVLYYTIFLVLFVGSAFSISPNLLMSPVQTSTEKSTYLSEEDLQSSLQLIQQNYLHTVKPIFQHKCFDCHAVHADNSWFGSLPLITYLLDWQGHSAKKMINMSDDYPFTGRYDFLEQIYEIETAIKKDKMPPPRYRRTHQNAELTTVEKQIIMQWTEVSKFSLQPKSQRLEFQAAAFKPQFNNRSSVPVPTNNLLTDARIALGKQLFFDVRLSGSGKMSCATCHIPEKYWTDGLQTGLGHEGIQLTRNSPTIINMAWASSQFWDGRARTLEEQALGPISSEKEMHMDLQKLASTLNTIEAYRLAFRQAYPEENITTDTITKALAAFERTIVSQSTPFDRWLTGETQAISDEAKMGFIIFNTKTRCTQCHTGWRFTDDSFQDIGLNPVEPQQADLGRGAILNMPEMNHTFKTPTLRNVAQTAPYMHDGSLATLEEVIDFYNRGGDAKRDTLSPDVKSLELTPEEKNALVEFLKTLTEKQPEITHE